MSIFEYDEAKEKELIRKAEYEAGVKQGIATGIEQGIATGIEQGITAFILDNLEEQIPPERIIAKLMKRFQLSKETAVNYLDKYCDQSSN